jgi:hypothetical protein
MDGIAHRLLSAAEALGDSRSMLAPRARQKHLASAQGESVFRAQPGMEGFTLFFGERTYKDWSFHGPYCNSQHETYLEDALGLGQALGGLLLLANVESPRLIAGSLLTPL